MTPQHLHISFTTKTAATRIFSREKDDRQFGGGDTQLLRGKLPENVLTNLHLSSLRLYKIRGSHNSSYEQFYLLGYNAV
jgi:hypothetical protein